MRHSRRLPGLFTLVLLAASTLPSARAQQAKFVYPLPGADQFEKRTLTYAKGSDGKDLAFDIYLPKSTKPTPVFVGLNGVGGTWMRSHAQYAGWGALVTTAGFAGIAMDAEGGKTVANFDALMEYLRKNSKQLNIDPEQVVVYSCSANVRDGMPMVHEPARTYIRGAIFYYGYGEYPAGTEPQFRIDLPVFVGRAGLDAVALNTALDDFTAKALRVNAPWTIANLSGGLHGFEIFNDDDASRAVVKQTLEFIRSAVDPAQQAARARTQLNAQAAAFAMQGKWKEARVAYEQIVARDPNSNDAHYKLAQALENSGEERQALVHYRKALELGNFNRGYISYSAAKIELKHGNTDGALGWIENMKNNAPMIKRLRAEKEFDVVRENPRFQAVVSTVP